MAWEHMCNSMLVRPGLGWATRSAWILHMVQASVKLTTYPSFTHAQMVTPNGARGAYGMSLVVSWLAPSITCNSSLISAP